MNISDTQRNGIKKVIEGLQDLLEEDEGQVFNLYGFDPETEIDILRNQISNLSNDLVEIAKAVDELRNVIKPDETDLHNINRRIDVIMQRVATLESKKRWW